MRDCFQNSGLAPYLDFILNVDGLLQAQKLKEEAKKRSTQVQKVWGNVTKDIADIPERIMQLEKQVHHLHLKAYFPACEESDAERKTTVCTHSVDVASNFIAGFVYLCCPWACMLSFTIDNHHAKDQVCL